MLYHKKEVDRKNVLIHITGNKRKNIINTDEKSQKEFGQSFAWRDSTGAEDSSDTREKHFVAKWSINLDIMC
jgi:hypothetical protein